MLTNNELDSMIDCNTLYWMGIVHIFIFIGSIAFNSKLIWIYIHDKKKDSKSSIDLFVAVMAFLNFLGSLFELPFVSILLKEVYMLQNFKCNILPKLYTRCFILLHAICYIKSHFCKYYR